MKDMSAESGALTGPVAPSPLELSVLVVEDEAAIRETLREFFIGKGYRVSVATNGDQARDLIDVEQGFDLVVTDLRLPVGDGVEILKTARATNPEGYVVLMTGFASLESAIEAVRLGAFDYLVKPFSLSELDLTLSRIVEYRRLSDANQELTGELERLRPFRDVDEQYREIRAALDEIRDELRKHSRILEQVTQTTPAPPAGLGGKWVARKV